MLAKIIKNRMDINDGYPNERRKIRDELFGKYVKVKKLNNTDTIFIVIHKGMVLYYTKYELEFPHEDPGYI